MVFIVLEFRSQPSFTAGEACNARFPFFMESAQRERPDA